MAESAHHITCQEVVELATDYFEGALPADETGLFEQHLDFCAGCAWYVDQMRTTVETVGGIREEDVPAETRDRLLAAFRDWKRSLSPTSSCGPMARACSRIPLEAPGR